jgi:Tfp pilus assembly protein PilX
MNASQSTQRGAATLAITLLLLFGASIIAFYLNRGLIFEQKTSANQARATTAFEAAEAGLEWATGMLNQPNDVLANCTTTNTSNISFRRKYVQTQWNAGVNPTSTVVVATPILPIGCYIDASGQTQCSCPDVAATSSTLLNTATPRPAFTVTFAADDSATPDPLTVRVTSVGCSAATGPCTAATSSASDATATVRVKLKMRQVLRAAPAAALTCGGTCTVSGGSFAVANFDASVNGITINAGTAATGVVCTGNLNNRTVATVTGLPCENSVIAPDPTLAAIANPDPNCTTDAMFRTYFGTTIAEFRRAPGTVSVANATEFDQQLGNGYRSFYFTGDADLQGSRPDIGSQNDPVTIVMGTGGNFRVNAGVEVWGLIFSANAAAGNTGTGSSQIHGAVITCNNFDANGNGSLTYDGLTLNNAQLSTATFVRVPGSWRDF